MRADNDHAVGNSVENCEDESKPQNSLEEKWEDAELKILENGKNGSNNVSELFYDTRTGDEWDKENDGNHSCGDSIDAGKDSIDAKSGSLETVDPVFFMDKNVTACDLPEIVVCYKEDTYNVVKDICVDEGVPVQEKFLFGEKGSVKCCSDSSNQCESEDLMKADKGTETKSSEEDRNGKADDSELCNDPKSNQDVEVSSREDFADAEGSSSRNQDHLIVTREEAKDSLTSEISHEIEVATLENNVPKESLTLGDILSWEDEPKPLSNNNNNSDTDEEQSPRQLQEKERHEPKEAEEKLCSVPTTISQEPNKSFKDPETDNQHPNLLVGDSLEDNKLISSGFGETSFSAAEAVSISGHITYTGPIAFSGSLSVRSDASTTSGRSFAFPVLQSEWNSSPVRMAKPEKRRHKGWKQILLCCRSS